MNFSTADGRTRISSAAEIVTKFIEPEERWNAAIDKDTKDTLKEAVTDGSYRGNMFNFAIGQVLDKLEETGVYREFKHSALYVNYRCFLGNKEVE